MSSSRRPGRGAVPVPPSSVLASHHRVSAALLQSVAEGEDADDSLMSTSFAHQPRLGSRAMSSLPRSSAGLLSSDRLGPSSMNAARRLRLEQVQRMEQVRAELDHVEHACRERSTRLADTRAAALANRHQLDAVQSRQRRVGESDVVKRRFQEMLAAKDRSLGANFGVADSLLHFHWQLDEAAANAYSSTAHGASHVVAVAAAAATTAAATTAAVFKAAEGSSVDSHASSAAVPASGATSRTATPPRDSTPGNSKRMSSVRVVDTPPSTPPATPVAAASTSNATVIASPARTNYRTWNPTGIQLIALPAGVAVAASELGAGL